MTSQKDRQTNNISRTWGNGVAHTSSLGLAQRTNPIRSCRGNIREATRNQLRRDITFNRGKAPRNLEGGIQEIANEVATGETEETPQPNQSEGQQSGDSRHQTSRWSQRGIDGSHGEGRGNREANATQKDMQVFPQQQNRNKQNQLYAVQGRTSIQNRQLCGTRSRCV